MDLPDGSADSRVWDEAGLFVEPMEKKMLALQEELQQQHDVKVWVVTISSLTSQKATGLHIEQYAAKLYDQKIRASGANESSILFLISRSDRKARIELGDDWGHEWDEQCEEIMLHSAIPSFRTKDYDVGTMLTLRALTKMVEQRDDPSFSNQAEKLLASWGSSVGAYSPLPAYLVIPVCLLGVIIVGCGAFANNGRGALMGLGGVVLFASLFAGGIWHAIETNWDLILFGGFVTVIVILSMFAGGGRGSHYGSWNSGSSSFDGGFDFGGGGGGGFDFGGGGGFDFGGGGGATGDW